MLSYTPAFDSCCVAVYLLLCCYRYLALMAGLASEADWVFIPEWPPQRGWEDMLCKKLAAVSIQLHSA